MAARGRVVLVFDKAERLAARGASHDLLRALIELPSLFSATCGGGAAAAGAVQPIFVGESLWPDFHRIGEGDCRVLHFRFEGCTLPYTLPHPATPGHTLP